MGDPAAHARYYNDEGADELAILDITASSEKRKSLIHVIEAVADSIFIPVDRGGRDQHGGRHPGSAECRSRQGEFEHGGGKEARVDHRRQPIGSAVSVSLPRLT